MRRLLLVGTILAAAATGSLPAYAACSGNVTVGNIVWISGCASDNQANDGDDLKMFIDKVAQNNIQVIDGSLGSNNQAFDNIRSAANAGFETDGSGFANFKSVDAGSPTNPLTVYTFTPGPSTTLPDGTPFHGFDGQLFRGQIDNTGGFTGKLDLTVLFADGTTASHTFTGLSDKKDFGVLGFDEVNDPGVLVSRVLISLANEGGAWNEFKQIEFSVPGAVGAIPETSTWAMIGIGFGLLALVGTMKTRTPRMGLE